MQNIWNNYFGNGGKYFQLSRSLTHGTNEVFGIHGFRDSVPVCKIHGLYLDMQKFEATSHSCASDTRRLHSTVCSCKQPTSNSFQTSLYCVYLLKLYDKSIIILLTNDSTNTCSKISKIWLILWMVYTCNVKAKVKGLEEVETLGRNECTLHRWSRSPEMRDCRRSYH